MSPTEIRHLRCEYRNNPLGLDVLHPRFSWQLRTERLGARQTAYRVLVATNQQQLQNGHADLWDSGKVETDQSIHINYAGVALQARQRAYWQVTVWDETDTTAISTELAWFEMGLLRADDWTGKWIGSNIAGGKRTPIPVPHLRKAFKLSDAVASARLYVTALGLFECSLNGKRIGEDVFAPGWTDYNKRVQYLTYDVTAHLMQGENVIGVLLGDGWAVGYIGWLHRQNYSDRPQLLAQLEITLMNGEIHTIVSNDSWEYAFGAITHSDFLQGEAYDARRELIGWDTSAFGNGHWFPVQAFDNPTLNIVAISGSPVRRMNELPPISAPLDRSSMGRRRYLFDLGQNMVGRIRFKGADKEGATVIIRFAEVLNSDGTPYYTNLRTAQATDYYTFRGDAEEIWESRFTFHGFRYVEIEGYTGQVTRETVVGIVLHTDMEQSGHFECSEPLLNQLQSNILWGQKGNFVDIPTDCPQRDERLGWTGDIQVFLRTATFNMNVATFMTKWAKDVDDAQFPDGSIPAVVPYAAEVPKDGGPAWADAAIICPWTIYQSYGDVRILEDSYPTMNRFMDFLLTNSPGYVRCAPDFEGWPGFGDWLSINASTPRDLLGTAFLAYDAHLMAQIAQVLGKLEEAQRYQTLFEDVKAVFINRYLVGSEVPTNPVTPSTMRRMLDEADKLSRGLLQVVDYGEITSQVFNTDIFTPTQTAYVLALHFNLLPEAMRPIAGQELVADLERRGMHLSAGFVGSPYLNHVLTQNGHLGTAYQLLMQESWPSWLYAVTQGATTIWERWDGWTAENGFQTPEMNSFNHYAYGAIGAWLYHTVAGIDLGQAGYKHINLAPQPGGGLTYARAKLNTLYGEIISDWRQELEIFSYLVNIPPNATATVTLPYDGKISLNGESVVGQTHSLSSGRYQFHIAR